MDKRRITIGVAVAAVLVIAGSLFVMWRRGAFTSLPDTKVGTRTTYGGPSTRPAEEWPQWRGPRRDGISHETGLLTQIPPEGLKQLWSADVGIGYSSPIAADGVVYLFSLHGGRETLTAFDANSGDIRWSDSGTRGWSTKYPGTRATPAIADGRVYTYGGAGDLTCRNVGDGKPVWSVNVLKETGSDNIGWGVSSTPLVHAGRVYVQSGKGGSVAVAVDAGSGKLSWKSQATGLGGYAHPVIAAVGGAEQLVIFAGDAVYGMNPQTGQTLWSHPWRTSYDVNSTPPVYDDGRLFISSGYGHGCAMFELSATSGKLLWENKEIASRFPGMILDTQRNRLYANSEGTFVCMSWPDGKVLWSAKEPKLGIGGSIVLTKDGHLLTLSERGRLAASRDAGDRLEVISQADVVDWREAWSTPLIYGKRLYVKGAQEFLCFDFTERK
jgi:outer membrane protein assembly factor BamB